jgi:hypothetical protein
MNKTNTLAGFTFPVTDGNTVYRFDQIERLVCDHADGDAYAVGDDNEGWTIRVRQYAIKPSIGSGWTELEAWQDAAEKILNGANGSGYSNDDSWDDLHSATEMLNDADDEDARKVWQELVDMLVAAGATL